jgi:hypothetical protein
VTSPTWSATRFRREGRWASAINHPRSVFVLAADEEAGQPYIVMELMPGPTLKDLVEEHGPLEPAEAVANILDVIEGLQAAHRLQVLHRDVKPANCFLEGDGRVKVGDFGLSRSLIGDIALTQTGTFLGTLPYAAPEQIRDATTIDFRSDLYAVAATLYFLLTGQPPFPDANPAAVVARKASEAAPPVRSVRPEVPPALDRVVLRGLERDRERRWRDLAEFRQALLPFLPGHLSAGGLGLRVGALLIDLFLGILASLVLMRTRLATILPGDSFFDFLLNLLGSVAYFALMEGLWGCTLGKRLLRLRVCTAWGSDRPGPLRTVLRTGLFHLLWMPWIVLDSMELFGTWLTIALWPAATIFGTLVTVSTMRARSGYRGPHEWLSGTRVVQLPWPEVPSDLARRQPNDRMSVLAPPEGLARQIGPFAVRIVLSQTEEEQILLGEDVALKRSVWLRLRSTPEPLGEAVRRDVRRPTRLRWLAGGRLDERRWDAFLAPGGCPLADYLSDGKPLSWPQVRPLLEQLAEEVTAASRDGTLPATLTLDQVWVQPDGRLQLLDLSLFSAAASTSPPSAAAETDKGLPLLREVALLMLEGRLRPPDSPPSSIRAPLPRHASRLLDRVLGMARPFGDVEQVQAELAATRHLPAEVRSDRRAAHLAVLWALLSPGLILCFFCSCLCSFVLMTGLTEDILQADALVHILDEHPSLRQELLSDPEFARFYRDFGSRLPSRLETNKKNWRDRQFFLKYTIGLLPENDLDVAEVELILNEPAKAVEVQRLSGVPFKVAVTRDGTGGRTTEYNREALTEALVPSTGFLYVFGPLFALAGLLLSLVVLLAWVIWAFLFQGGWSYRLMGIALVRSNGRPALRIQCAWRTFLVWAPITGLLALSAWLDSRFWSGGVGVEPDWWSAGLAVKCWWLALGLLAVYFVLAFRRPTRALHDRLAGVYLVPR